MLFPRSIFFALAVSLVVCSCVNDERRIDRVRDRDDAASAVGDAVVDDRAVADASDGGRDCRSAAARSSEVRIASVSETGTRLVVTGVVRSAATRSPLAGVSIYAYHTDANGLYSREGPMRPRLCGKLLTDASGRYRITTIKPGAYPEGGNPSHIHFELSGDAVELQHLELFFDGDPYLTPEFIHRELGGSIDRSDVSSTVRQTTVDASGTELCERDIVVRTR